MKNFIKLIEQVHAERFSVVVNELIAKKIPIAFLSIDPIIQAIENVKNFRAQGLNISMLFVADTTPPPPPLTLNLMSFTSSKRRRFIPNPNTFG